MIAIADHRMTDGLRVLPERDEPYRLEAVYEVYRDDCRSEVLLQFDGGYLRVWADEEDDMIGIDFHREDFEPSREHRRPEDLTASELKVLRQVAKAPSLKQRHGIPAKVAGALTRKGYGKQGGLLRRGLITGKKVGRKVQYDITAAGRRALAGAIWQGLIGKECGWSWVAWNQQGYRDSILLSFDGIIPTILLCVSASAVEVFSITSC